MLSSREITLIRVALMSKLKRIAKAESYKAISVNDREALVAETKALLQKLWDMREAVEDKT